MNLVVDTNIIFSALITPKGTIAELIFNKPYKSILISPRFIFDELQEKTEKILKITGYSDRSFFELLYLISKNIEFIDDNLITSENLVKAYKLVEDIDKKDLLFVALALQTGYSIWTGDLKLINGLRNKGFINVLSTQDLVKRIKS